MMKTGSILKTRSHNFLSQWINGRNGALKFFVWSFLEGRRIQSFCRDVNDSALVRKRNYCTSYTSNSPAQLNSSFVMPLKKLSNENRRRRFRNPLNDSALVGVAHTDTKVTTKFPRGYDSFVLFCPTAQRESKLR